MFNYMNIILWIIFGGIAGWLGSIFMGNDASQGLLGNIIVGIIGAWLGGYLMTYFGKTGVTGFNLYSLIVAVLGAVILIALFRLLF